MAKKRSQADSNESGEPANVSLEDAMSELSSIVAELESGQQSLDESLAQFEQGMKLLRVCHNKLDVAAQRIEIVTQMPPEGDIKTADFESTATLQKSPVASRATRKQISDEGDDALLF